MLTKNKYHINKMKISILVNVVENFIKKGEVELKKKYDELYIYENTKLFFFL